MSWKVAKKNKKRRKKQIIAGGFAVRALEFAILGALRMVAHAALLWSSVQCRAGDLGLALTLLWARGAVGLATELGFALGCREVPAGTLGLPLSLDCFGLQYSVVQTWKNLLLPPLPSHP